MTPAFPTLQDGAERNRGTINVGIMTTQEGLTMKNQQNHDEIAEHTDPLARRVSRARMELREREISRILSARPRLRRLSTTATRH